MLLNSTCGLENLTRGLLDSILMIYSYFQISAQESRRKKKEFVDTLERKVDVAVQDLEDYKKKCELLQKQNTSLRSQLKSLRSILANNNSMSQSTTIKPDPDCKSLFFLLFVSRKGLGVWKSG